MHWTELQRIYLPELGMCWGPACDAFGREREFRKNECPSSQIIMSKALKIFRRMVENNPSRDRKVNRARTNYSFCLLRARY